MNIVGPSNSPWSSPLHTVAEPKRRRPKQFLDQGSYHPATGNGPAPWPMEPAKQVPSGRGTTPQQHAWVGLHRLATLRLRWTPNNEACCEWVPVDLLRRWHLRTTSSTGCSLQLAAETKLEIMKSKRQQQQPLHMVSKPSGGWRACGDYRALNAVSEDDRYPIPHMQEFAVNLIWTHVFSKMDLVRAYNQVPMNADDTAKTAIGTPFGLFEYLRLPLIVV